MPWIAPTWPQTLVPDRTRPGWARTVRHRWFPYPLLLASYGLVGSGQRSVCRRNDIALTLFHPSHRARRRCCDCGSRDRGAGLGPLGAELLKVGVAPLEAELALIRRSRIEFAVVGYITLRDRPEETDLEPFGHDENPVNTSNKSAKLELRLVLSHTPWHHLRAFAATLLTYTTFIVTAMVDELSINTTDAGLAMGRSRGVQHIFGTCSARSLTVLAIK